MNTILQLHIEIWQPVCMLFIHVNKYKAEGFCAGIIHVYACCETFDLCPYMNFEIKTTLMSGHDAESG